MSGSQKALKVISIIIIVLAIVSIVFGIGYAALVFNEPQLLNSSIEVQGESYGMATTAVIVAGFSIVSGVFDLIIGCLGLRGAKSPAKIGAFYVLAWIGLILEGIELILSLVSFSSGTADLSTVTSSVISVAIVAVCVYLAHDIKKQA